jgi:hypothetical protein
MKRFNIILQLRLALPSGLFTERFPIKMLYEFLNPSADTHYLLYELNSFQK